MSRKLKCIQYGLGPIGQRIVKYVVARENVELEGAIDVDKNKVGRDVGELIGIDPLGIIVSDNAEDVLKNCEAEVVILSTVSSLANLEGQIFQCIKHGKNVVTSSEEIVFPWIENTDLAKRIDLEAKKAGVTIIGAGVNPGFTMDALPIFLTSVCKEVDSIRIERHQDASIRRLPFQQKIGAGLQREDFEKKVEQKIIRHVGFTESIQMIANCMGWRLERTEDIVEPVIAQNNVESPFIKVAKGEVSGVCQTGRGFMNGKPVITLELQAYLGHPAPKEAVLIEGDPPINMEVKGGINGDVATCAMMVNCLPKTLQSQPGLKTMPEIGLVSWYQSGSDH